MTYFNCVRCGKSGILPHACQAIANSPAVTHVADTGHSVEVRPAGTSVCLVCEWTDLWMEQPDGES